MKQSEKFYEFSDTKHIRENLRKSSLRGAFFTAVASGFEFTLRLISTLILARLLIPEYFGLIGMVTAITGFAERLSSMGLLTATIQTLEIDYRQCTNLFWINVGLGCAFGILVIGAAPLISAFYQDERIGPITLAISTNFLFRGLTVQHVALLHRQMKQQLVACNLLIACFISNCAAVALAATDYGYWALVWRDIISAFAYALGIWVLCPWMPGIPSRRSKIGSLMRFGRDMTLTQILGALSFHIDSLLIGKFSGAKSLGLYRQAYNLIVTPIEQLEMPIWAVSQSGLSRIQNDPERYRRYFKQILFVVSLATMPLGAFVGVYAHEIVLVVLGQKWMEAGIFLQILGVGAAIQPIAGITSLVLVTCGKTQKNFWIVLVNTTVIITVMASAIPWGALGICLAKVFANFLILLPRIHFSLKNTPVSTSDFFRVIWRPLSGSLTMAIALLVMHSNVPIENGIASLLVGGCIAIVVYLGFIVIIPGGLTLLDTLIQNLLSALGRHSAEKV